MIEVEEVGDDEFLQLEAALAAAEQQYAAKTSSGTCSLEWPVLQPAGNGEAGARQAAGTKRKLPASFAGSSAPAAAAAGAAGPPAPLQFPLLRYLGPIQYLYTAVEVDELCGLLCSSGTRALGFDIEWRVTYKAGEPPRPVAVVQLCQPQPPAGYNCMLLHIARTGMTPRLQQLLCCKEILKVGVGAHGDSLKIQRDFGFEMGGVLDLSEFANMRLCKDGQLPQKWSLAGLTEQLMGRSLEKAQSLRCGDWEQYPLSAEQRKYAATDVFASLRVFEVLDSMPVVWQPTLLVPAPALGPANSIDAREGGLVLACHEVAPLQPAKLAVYQAHMQQGLSLQQVALQRHIQEDSAQGYFAEAITAGYAYCWSRLGVPHDTLQRVADEAGRLLGHSLECEIPPEQQEQHAKQQHGGWKGGSGSSGGLGEQQQQQPEQPPGAGSTGAGRRPVDVLQALLSTGAKIRELKEQHWEDIPYGHLRLALAHLGRCNPGPWE